MLQRRVGRYTAVGVARHRSVVFGTFNKDAPIPSRKLTINVCENCWFFSRKALADCDKMTASGPLHITVTPGPQTLDGYHDTLPAPLLQFCFVEEILEFYAHLQSSRLRVANIACSLSRLLHSQKTIPSGQIQIHA